MDIMEERAFTRPKERILKRRLMEAQQGGGAEVRKVHIVYFLSRKGRIEHPHLVRVHHLSRNGVHLRDVKRWLGELRGKDLPESFAWSYKRRYKTGYVWQDLLDDDLITPISDNEYVLKGSEISSTTYNKDFAYVDKKIPMQEDTSSLVEEIEVHQPSCKEETQSQSHSQTSIDVSHRTSSEIEIEEESPTFGSEKLMLTDDSPAKPESKKKSHQIKQEIEENVDETAKDNETPASYASFYSTMLNKKNKKKDNVTKTDKTGTKQDSSKRDPSFSKSKSYSSNGASEMFRNLMTCGKVQTNDSALVAIDRKNKPFLNICVSDQDNVIGSSEVFRWGKTGLSQRIFGTPWNQQQLNGRRSFDRVKDSAKSKSECREQRTSFAAYKPVNGPSCSQCGKPFKPEKLHGHMKSCKGMKVSSKSLNPPFSAAQRTSSRPSTDQSPFKASVSGYFLAH